MEPKGTAPDPTRDHDDADLIAGYVAEGCAVPRKGSPFSNSTEGVGWMYNWCDRCMVDAPFRNGIAARGCRLIELAYIGFTPGEWLDGPRDDRGAYSIADQYHCMNFKGQGGRSPEPRPIPSPPGQGDLFDPEPMRGPKVLTSEPLRVGVLV